LALVASYQAKVIELEKEEASNFLRADRAKRQTLGDSLKQVGAGLSQVGGSIVDGLALGGKAAVDGAKAVGNAVGDGIDNAGSAISRGVCGMANWNCGAGLRSVSEWEAFKDNAEAQPIPEDEVDNLEVCVSSCWSRDQWLDLQGIAFEEKREKWERTREVYTQTNFGLWAACRIDNSCPISKQLMDTMPIPCGQCCAKIPNSMLVATKLGEEAPTGAALEAARKSKLLTWETTKRTCGIWYDRVADGTFKED